VRATEEADHGVVRSLELSADRELITLKADVQLR
jgi:hypothetical protein